MKEDATSLTASLGTYCSFRCISSASLSNPSAPPGISQGEKVIRGQRTHGYSNSRKRRSRSCSFLKISTLSYQIHVDCFQHCTQHIMIDNAYWIKPLNQYSHRHLGHFRNHIKTKRLKSQSITDIDMAIKHLSFLIDVFSTLANGLGLWVYKMLFQLWYEIKKSSLLPKNVKVLLLSLNKLLLSDLNLISFWMSL